MDSVRFTNGSPPPPAGAPRTAAGGARAPLSNGSGATVGLAPSAGIDPSFDHHPSTPVGTSAGHATQLDLTLLRQQIGEHIESERRSLAFEFDEEFGRPVVSVYDAETKELVRQIPPDELLRIADVMRQIAEEGERRDVATGLLLNEQV